MNQVRTVEELEGLLQKAEIALDVQARYIEKLQRQSLERQLQSPDGVAEQQTTSENAMDETVKRTIELEKLVESLQEQLASEKEELERSNMEIQILNTNLQRLEVENKESKQKRNTAEETVRTLERELQGVKFELKGSKISLNTLKQESNRLHAELERVEKKQSQREASPTEQRREFKARDADDQTPRDGLTNIGPHRNVRKSSGGPENPPNRQYMSSLEQRLNQLVNAHRQLLRKYASLELANGELYALLCLKDEQIKHYERTNHAKDGEDKKTILELEQRIEHLRAEKLQEIERLKEKLSCYGGRSGTRRASMSPHSGTMNIVQPLRGQKSNLAIPLAASFEEPPAPSTP